MSATGRFSFTVTTSVPGIRRLMLTSEIWGWRRIRSRYGVRSSHKDARVSTLSRAMISLGCRYRAPGLDRSYPEKCHASRSGAYAPGRGHDNSEEKKRADDAPAGFSQALAGAHRRVSRWRFSSGPVWVMSPAPIVITTSPSRTNSFSAAARSHATLPRHCASASSSEDATRSGDSRNRLLARRIISARKLHQPGEGDAGSLESRVREMRLKRCHDGGRDNKQAAATSPQS